MKHVRVGVLALQGGYLPHLDCLAALDVEACAVRTAGDLENCTALVLPGGESTSMTRLIETRSLLPALSTFASTHPVLGTCAGLILMAGCDDERVVSLRLLDAQVARNAYGRQTRSFETYLPVDLGAGPEAFPAIFIRAPQIVSVGADVEVLARYNGHAVLIAQGPHVGMSFHPELAGDPRVHAAWLERTARTMRSRAVVGSAFA